LEHKSSEISGRKACTRKGGKQVLSGVEGMENHQASKFLKKRGERELRNGLGLPLKAQQPTKAACTVLAPVKPRARPGGGAFKQHQPHPPTHSESTAGEAAWKHPLVLRPADAGGGGTIRQVGWRWRCT